MDANYHPLIVGDEYFVFAIIFYANRIGYLISPDESAPIWAPSCLFSIVDPRLGSDFYMTVIDEDSQFSWLKENYGAKFILGYQEITESFEHFVGIVERNESDLMIFLEQKLRYC